MVYLLGIPKYNPQPDDVEFIDGEMGLLQLQDPTPDDGWLDRNLGTGRPVDPTHVPKKVRWTFARYDLFIEPLGIWIWYWRAPFDFRRQGKAHLLPEHLKNEDNPKLVFDRAKIGNHHLWVDKHVYGGGPFVSGELAAALREGNFTGLGLHPKESV